MFKPIDRPSPPYELPKILYQVLNSEEFRIGDSLEIKINRAVCICSITQGPQRNTFISEEIRSSQCIHIYSVSGQQPCTLGREVHMIAVQIRKLTYRRLFQQDCWQSWNKNQSFYVPDVLFSYRAPLSFSQESRCPPFV